MQTTQQQRRGQGRSLQMARVGATRERVAGATGRRRFLSGSRAALAARACWPFGVVEGVRASSLADGPLTPPPLPAGRSPARLAGSGPYRCRGCRTMFPAQGEPAAGRLARWRRQRRGPVVASLSVPLMPSPRPPGEQRCSSTCFWPGWRRGRPGGPRNGRTAPSDRPVRHSQVGSGAVTAGAAKRGHASASRATGPPSPTPAGRTRQTGPSPITLQTRG